MKLDCFGVLLAVGIAVCLLWAAVEAKGISHRSAPAPTVADASVVESSFRGVQAARAAGKAEEALLELRERADKGPYPGYAWFLIGELAWGERAFGAAVRSYRKAVDLDAGVVDRTSAFSSGRTLADRLRFLSRDPWAKGRPQELSDFRYLQRRLSGGCE